MHLISSVCILGITSAILLETLPQKPLFNDYAIQQTEHLPSSSATSRARIRVGLVFASASSVDVPKQYAEIPLGMRTSPFDSPTLPIYPLHARIINATSYTTHGSTILTSEDLDNIICIAYPEASSDTSISQYRRKPQKLDQSYPLWWNVDDGDVDFGDPLGRCFLAGRGVESYECL